MCRMGPRLRSRVPATRRGERRSAIGGRCPKNSDHRDASHYAPTLHVAHAESLRHLTPEYQEPRFGEPVEAPLQIELRTNPLGDQEFAPDVAIVLQELMARTRPPSLTSHPAVPGTTCICVRTIPNTSPITQLLVAALRLKYHI